ncbi:pyridine nucleotide-disulfide oxidoreductase [Rhodovulum euryhalinum]|uniref:Pyridine nucleotide-disulfide oxidoreductase n=2 Tax=Rhodovulum euryhalinum TaxID=35805 RepID=A0A4R2KDG2_9RHOB|nr:FAD-dependent oxidoreductase [Rhodovulum euryhalinum]TCO71621.1 pyridine nucleotide-disulfide oxidoreductase [Rhodovulum euryhalinum]
MQSPSRRHFTLGLAAVSALAGAGGLAATLRPGLRAIVIGGGPAGAAAALSLRAANPAASVLLVERDPGRLSRAQEGIEGAAFTRPRARADLDALRQAGVGVVLDDVVGIDWASARLSLFSGRTLAFDRLLLAPGTSPRDEAIPGLDAVARHAWPAAWGSAREARRLAGQLAALPERGHVVLRLPAEISHPHAALTRAVDLARHLAAARPAARLTVLDGSATDDLASAFVRAVPNGVAAGVQWRTAADGGIVRAVDARRGLIETDAGGLRADVVNFVPALTAGAIASTAGLVDHSGWCPCDTAGRSSLRRDVLVLGDARKSALRTLAGALRSAEVATKGGLVG